MYDKKISMLKKDIKRALQKPHNKIYDELFALKIDLELIKKRNIVLFVIEKVPTVEELEEFMRLRRIDERLLKDHDMECIYKQDNKWFYHKDSDIYKHGL
jgi:hypothetical protein